jgi:hypothetical protein
MLKDTNLLEPQAEKVGEFRAPEPSLMSMMMKKMKAPSGSLNGDLENQLQVQKLQLQKLQQETLAR